MNSDAEIVSLLSDSRSAGAWRSDDHVVLQKRFVEPPPHPTPPCFLGICMFRGLTLHLHVCAPARVCPQQHFTGYIPVEITIPHKTRAQKVRTEENKMCFCSLLWDLRTTIVWAGGTQSF